MGEKELLALRSSSKNSKSFLPHVVRGNENIFSSPLFQGNIDLLQGFAGGLRCLNKLPPELRNPEKLSEKLNKGEAFKVQLSKSRVLDPYEVNLTSAKAKIKA